MVHVDFGNGAVIHRTWHGNIATYVCNEEGRLIDILPGLYTPDAYWQSLERLLAVARSAAKVEPSELEGFLRSYHRQEMRAARKLDLTPRAFAPPLESAEDQANWKLLTKDTIINTTVRSQAIHLRLQNFETAPRPSQIVRWLYKEILHADLEDPYLGLGEKMFASYPFEKPAEQNNSEEFIKTGIGPLAEIEGR